MKEYFLLQFKMLNRKMIDFGLPLLIGYALLLFVFVLLSNYLFGKTEFAVYAYGLIAFSFVSILSEPRRNDFLKSVYNKYNYKKLRILENILYCLPFTLFLIYKKQFIFSIIINFFVVLITLFNFSTNLNITIPTPFSKKPFEFTVGFRKTFYVFPIAYFLTYISVSVGNFNLGVFSMLLVGLVCMFYYSKPENECYVWNFNLSSKEFLIKKTKSCVINFTLLSLPILVTLSSFFLNEVGLLILIYLMCVAYLIVMIVAKYSAYPNDVNISQGVLITLCFMFPPMLIVVIPLFYSQSIKKLNKILE
jgi:hypothetical protein